MVFKRGIGHFRNTQHIHTVQPAHQCDKPPGDIRGVSSKRKFSCLFALLDNCDRFLMPHLHREEISISDVRVPVGQNLRLSPQFYVRLKAAVFASGFSGPIAGALVSRLGLRLVATGGMALSALSFYGLAMTDFSTQQWQAWGLMALLGFSTASALLASTSAIMAAVPAEKAAAAGAIETMAYELGAGLGIAIFGLLLSRSFSASIRLPAGLEAQEIARASSSMGEAVQLANSLPPTQGQAILDAARHAFIWSHSVALSSAGSMLLLLAVGMWFSLAKAQRR